MLHSMRHRAPLLQTPNTCPPFHELHTVLILVLVTTLSAKSFTLYHTYIPTSSAVSGSLLLPLRAMSFYS